MVLLVDAKWRLLNARNRSICYSYLPKGKYVVFSDRIQMPEPLLQFDHVTKEFDLNKNWFGKPSNRFRAVNEVTWQVEQGAALGILGE